MDLDFRKQKDRKLAIVDKKSTRLVDIEIISYLECDGYVTSIHINGHETISVSKLLKNFENELTEYGFLRANHNTIVNPKHIEDISSTIYGVFLQINKSKIKVSRRRRYLFKNHPRNENPG
ncbi:MAG: LytR/AlgR family response regulator transcription factor [Bacteroidales bacterium]